MCNPPACIRNAAWYELVVMRTLIRILACCLVSVTFSVGSQAADTERQQIGAYEDWTAYKGVKGSKRYCYIGTEPKEAKGDYTRRGPTYVLVTHWPDDNIFGEVSVEAGYPYDTSKDTTVDIGGKTYKLFTKNRNGGDGIAWTYEESADEALVASMKSGATMVVEGISSRGTKTKDTYSLKGFTAAYEAITEACRAQ